MLQRFIREEKGLHSSEYALILGLICAALIAAVVILVTAIEARYNSTSDLFNDIMK
jgi:Flp pilus assembly pilin Flp